MQELVLEVRVLEQKVLKHMQEQEAPKHMQEQEAPKHMQELLILNTQGDEIGPESADDALDEVG
ncbi:hypothetical protein EC988_005598 [Linderina pennispora]|nr:hypothetical protein EC988_005598 [Linderina pennispora]